MVFCHYVHICYFYMYYYHIYESFFLIIYLKNYAITTIYDKIEEKMPIHFPVNHLFILQN